MDEKELIKNFLHGNLSRDQIADFNRRLKDPVFCAVLDKEKQDCVRRDALTQTHDLLDKYIAAHGASESEQLELIAAYISGQMGDTAEANFAKCLDEDQMLRRQYILMLNIFKGMSEEVRQSNIEFGKAMQSLTREQIETIVGKRRSPEDIFNFKAPAVAACRSAAAGIPAARPTVRYRVASFDNGIQRQFRTCASEEAPKSLTQRYYDYAESGNVAGALNYGYTAAVDFYNEGETFMCKAIIDDILARFADNPAARKFALILERIKELKDKLTK